MLLQVVTDGPLFKLNLSVTLSTTLTAAKAKRRENKKFSNRSTGVDLSSLTRKTERDIRPENSMGDRAEKGDISSCFGEVVDDSIKMTDSQVRGDD
jgi:hypothetical protein